MKKVYILPQALDYKNPLYVGYVEKKTEAVKK